MKNERVRIENEKLGTKGTRSITQEKGTGLRFFQTVNGIQDVNCIGQQ